VPQLLASFVEPDDRRDSRGRNQVATRERPWVLPVGWELGTRRRRLRGGLELGVPNRSTVSGFADQPAR
jgi:hypothetical protein